MNETRYQITEALLALERAVRSDTQRDVEVYPVDPVIRYELNRLDQIREEARKDTDNPEIT